MVALTGLLALPTEAVSISSSPAGVALSDYLNHRFLGVLPRNRLCRGILVLPDEHASFLVGRRRQALRTNLRRARAAGISCEVLYDHGDVMAIVGRILAGRRRPPAL